MALIHPSINERTSGHLFPLIVARKNSLFVGVRHHGISWCCLSLAAFMIVYTLSNLKPDLSDEDVLETLPWLTPLEYLLSNSQGTRTDTYSQ